MKEYDLIVIGSGVGLSVLSQGLNKGWSCALIEKGKMGGTCLTRGCIPSKVLVYPADVIREAEHGEKVGVSLQKDKIDWNKISERMWHQIDESKQIDQGLSQAPPLDIYRGVGKFISNYEMKVKLNDTGEYSDSFKGKKIVIAAGARSIEPPIPGLKEVGYVTSETFFGEKFPEQPWESLTIIGGGIIAAEFAHIFSAMGTKVTIIEMLPRLVSTEEPKISEILEENLSKFMTVKTDTKAVNFKEENGMKVVETEHMESGEKESFSAEEIFLAVGRQSNSDLLEVENTNIETDSRGWIKTNKYLETDVDNIWAIGDINNPQYQFRHKANHDAEICTRNIFSGRKSPVDYSAVPWAIFTYPQIGHVGLTEQEAIAQGYKIYVAEKTYGSVAKGFAMGLENDPKDGFFKLVVNEDYRILGAHAIGAHAPVLIQPFVYLMNAGYHCDETKMNIPLPKLKDSNACPDSGSFMPIYNSMVIHPSLNEVTGWALGALRPVNIDQGDHHHHH